MNKFEIKSKELEKVTIKITVLQILALMVTCFVGMWMTSKEEPISLQKLNKECVCSNL